MIDIVDDIKEKIIGKDEETDETAEAVESSGDDLLSLREKIADKYIDHLKEQKDIVKATATAGKYYSKYANLAAVKNKRIYVIDGDIVSRLSPRLYEGVEMIAKCLRPELFEDQNGE